MSVVSCPVERTNDRGRSYELAAIPAVETLQNDCLVSDWRRIVVGGQARYAMHMSPEWIAHISRRSESRVMLWLARDNRQELVGVVPVLQREFKLTYDVSNRALWTKKLRVSEILGSEPILPHSQQLLRTLFESILDTSPDSDGILFDALPTDCFCHAAVATREPVMPSIAYSPYDQRPSIVVEIGPSFDDYMRVKSAKTRSKLRKLQSFVNSGELRVERYSHSSDAAELAESVSRVSARTWQKRLLGLQYRNNADTREDFCDLAGRGLLRSYVLWREGQPLAYVVGYQYDGVYYYADIGFDPAAAQFSPGTVLLFMILQDLHGYDPPRVLYFGTGDAAYKQRFGKEIGKDESVLLLRTGLRNRILTFTHRGFIASLDCVKRVVGRRVRS